MSTGRKARLCTREEADFWFEQMRRAVAGEPFLTHSPTDYTYRARRERGNVETELERLQRIAAAQHCANDHDLDPDER
jgi:hypothetical protein